MRLSFFLVLVGLMLAFAGDAYAQGRRFSRFGEAKPKVGDVCDDFKATFDDGGEFDLKKATDERPVLLFVGSCT